MRIFILFMFTMILISCDSYTDVHQEYIEGGEIVYLQKVDSVSTQAGDERILFKLWYNNGQRLTQTHIYYNDRKDTVVVDLKGKLKAGLDSVIFVSEFSESIYNFEIVNYNAFDQKSIVVKHFASSYGAMFRGTLRNRTVKTVTLGDENVTVEWVNPSSDYAWIELEYTSTEGKKVVKVTDENPFTIEEIPIDATFRYRTFFFPEENAIDALPCEWSEAIDIN